MSEFKVEVARVGKIIKHDNADTLSIADVNGYPVIIRTGEYSEGDLAVYVPIDAVVPSDDPRWSFLAGHTRIKAKRLRGVFSMGMLTKPDPDWAEGQDVREELRITKHDPDIARERVICGDDASPPDLFVPVYDIEGLRRHRAILEPGEQVWISEKIHGQNARFVHDGEHLHVASRTRFKKPDVDGCWANVARRYELAEKLSVFPGVAIYGETYGNNTDMAYGVKRSEEGDRLVLFDALDTRTGRWFDVDEFLSFAERLGLPIVPTLYRGPWSHDLAALCEGKTTMPGADHVREGIVVKPLFERTHRAVGRVFLKMAGEGYLTRKSA